MSSEHVFEYGLEQLFQHRAICLRGENYAKMSEEDRKNVAIGFLLGDTQYPHARIKELEARAAAFVLYRESTHEMRMEHVQLQRRIKELEDGIRKLHASVNAPEDHPMASVYAACERLYKLIGIEV